MKRKTPTWVIVLIVAIVVLFKTNSNVKNSLKVLILLYSVSVLSGLIVEFLESLI